jgi:hypothetical protein
MRDNAVGIRDPHQINLRKARTSRLTVARGLVPIKCREDTVTLPTALEIEVFDRVVLGANRKPPFTDREARAFGDSPAFQGSVHLRLRLANATEPNI